MIQPPRWRSLPVILFITGIAFLGSSALSVMAAPRGRGRPAGNPPRGSVDITPRGGVDVTPAAPRYRYNNAIVNPRWNPGLGNWWWNGNRPWYPTPRYWGGGFWGNLAIGLSSAAVAGAVAGSIANANNNPQVVVVNNSPGGQLLSSYELVQVPCSTSANLVVIAGPSDSVICARPTAAVPAGFYTVDTANLALIPDV